MAPEVLSIRRWHSTHDSEVHDDHDDDNAHSGINQIWNDIWIRSGIYLRYIGMRQGLE